MKLYEKYRPKDLGEVVGQLKAVVKIKTLLSRGGIGGQAFWISGLSGTGKTTIARIIAGEFCGKKFGITEFDSADKFDQGACDRLSQEAALTSIFGNRAFIINEAHGLRRQIIRQLLGILERIPPDMLIIFTTTKEGQQGLFDDQIDSHPLLSRCIYLGLSDSGLETSFASRAKEIALAEGLDGQPLSAYIALVRDCNLNFREVLQKIESGEMLTEEPKKACDVSRSETISAPLDTLDPGKTWKDRFAEFKAKRALEMETENENENERKAV